MRNTAGELVDENGNVIREPRNCKRCGMIYDASLHYDGPEPGECFTCWFWRTLIDHDKTEPNNVVVVDGHHFLVGEEPRPNENRMMLGFGGSRFAIKFNDGRVVITRNLWHQGSVPEYWRELFPDNAIFI